MKSNYRKLVSSEEEAVQPVLQKLGEYNPRIVISEPDFLVPVDGFLANLKIKDVGQYMEAMSDGLGIKTGSYARLTDPNGPKIYIRCYDDLVKKRAFGFIPLSSRFVPSSRIELSAEIPDPSLPPVPEKEPITFESVEQTRAEIMRYMNEWQQVHENNTRIKEEHRRAVIEPLLEALGNYDRMFLDMGYERSSCKTYKKYPMASGYTDYRDTKHHDSIPFDMLRSGE
ncbi:MAG: hypothetical protein QMD97_00205 [Candidatus Aenigmarchaeota archaeon]|nr:hypothetical protein [Candidatus Aenigmarchaeota archaeon]